MAAATAGSTALCCNPSLHQHGFFLHLDPSSFSPAAAAQSSVLLCPSLTISLIANTLPLPSSSSYRRPSMAKAAESPMTSSLDEECEAARVERLWQRFFSDPSQWWDKRFDKGNPEAPDFEHKTTKKTLRINDGFSPSWLQAKLATVTQQPPHQSSSSSYSSLSMPQISSGQASKIKKLWEEFFSDPAQWWDNRSDDKRNARFPDFQHKTARKVLWIDNRLNPPWVQARLAAMVQCQEQGRSGRSTPEISSIVRTEQLWREFFSDPSQWWDNRSIKKSPKYPDFRHKSTHKGLWIEDSLNPNWVKLKMATMALGQIQSGGGLISQYGNFGVDCSLGVQFVFLVHIMTCQCFVESLYELCRIPNSSGNGDNMSKLCQKGLWKESLHMVELTVQQNTHAPINAYVGLLKECTRRKDLAEGKRVHALIVQSGLDLDIFLGNTLVNMYGKCGSVLDARQVFNSMPARNVFSWTAIMSAYADHGQGEEAINLYQKMQQTGIKPDKVAYVVILKSCARIASLEQGKQLHSDIIKSGFESNVIVGNTLVGMYAKCGCIEDACKVFNSMSERDVVSWNAMIAGYAQQGLIKEALALYEKMKQEGLQPDKVTYVVLLKACASIAALEQGKQLHSHVMRNGFESNLIVGNTLVGMYAKCGCMEDAHDVFIKMNERDVVSWNAIIAGYAQKGLGKEAIALYEQMKQEGVQPDNVTYVVLLKTCASISALEKGKQIHSNIIRSGFKSNMIVRTALIDMYAKCGCIEDAREVFNTMSEQYVASWNAMIAGYAHQGLGTEALDLYEQMKQKGVQPDDVTYVVLLNACASIADLEQGKQLHSHIIRSGFELDVIMGSALVDMYAKCGSIEDAHEVFRNLNERDVVSWNAMIAGYAKLGLGMEVLGLYEQMKQENVQPNSVTYVILLNACASIAALEQGKQVHFHIIKSAFEPDVIMGSALVDMYAKCGSIEHARQVFNNMNERDVVSWNAMIAGYAWHGLGKHALALYEQMKQEDVQPNHVTFVVLLNACASIAALEQGKRLHSHIIKSGFELDVILGNALVNMYSKCGSMEHAHQVFNDMHKWDVVSWNSLIAGYAKQGLGKEVLTLLEQMQKEGTKPNEVTYVSVLSACSHSGLVSEGRHLFDSMCENHGVTPTVDHCACMVDLLGRAGCLADAEDFVKEMPIQPNALVWMTLLGAARNHGHLEIGRRAFDSVVKLESENAAAYVLLSNIYAATGRMDEVAKIRKKMKDAGVKQMPGCS